MPAFLHRLLLPLLFAGAARGEAPVDYERDVKPLLKERCVSCHGQVKQKAGLRLDAGPLIVKGGETGPALVAGKAQESLLLQRILSTDEDERMPPEGKPLIADKIDVLRRWIDGGAEFPPNEPIPGGPKEHWAFQPIRRPPVPSVNNRAWPRNPIDHFLLAKLEAKGWQPALPASSEALARRLHLDLTGLPPTLDEQRSFDLEKCVSELLSSPAYGERWARHWLDVVRYADSNGYERDAEKPFVWRYRDYVIRALNEDKPFNRFALEQIAGDEVADATAESTLGTGFFRLGHWDDEPADPAADRYDQLDDIVSTTGQAFLGLTIGCARCHDHKFEPLSTRDYYSLVAVFSPLQRPQKLRTELTVEIGAEKMEAYIWREPSPAAPKTHVLVRGSPGNPGDEVRPAVPAILVPQQPEFPPPDGRTTRRRLGLGQWIAADDNPLTARVIVNRVWQQHFGQGLVRTANDFGLMGAPPTHPELLDWLAHWFVHDAKWSLKALHHLILTSNAWRMSKGTNSAYAAADPDNNLLWHMPYRRLEVEAIRDSMLAVSGRLNGKQYGPAMKPAIPKAALEANTDKDRIWQASDETEASRRTIYAFVKRGLVVPMLEVLDLADTVSSCPQRQVTTVAPQALSLFNGTFVNQQARHLAARLEREAGPNEADQTRLAWQLALSRPPSKAELEMALKFREEESLEQFCRVLLNLNEFMYPE
ncbi:MAG TPA: PSD1 and planctomycete cytochrome C domain-containing protein [Prosthecobacter sp.]|nr:PSD1 and planctomycete cytochrome C domain-containing protein [Prosthecobacter sp.]